MRDGSDGLPEPQGPCGYQNTNVMQNILYSIVSFRTRHLHSHSHHTSTHDTHARTHVHSCERWRNDGVLHKKERDARSGGICNAALQKRRQRARGGKSSQKDRLQAHTHGHGVSKFAGEAGVAGVARGSSGRAGAVAAAVAAAAVEQQQQQQLVTRVTRASATTTATLSRSLSLSLQLYRYRCRWPAEAGGGGGCENGGGDGRCVGGTGTKHL